MKTNSRTIKEVQLNPNLAYKSKNLSDKLDVFKKINDLGFNCTGNHLFDKDCTIITNDHNDRLNILDCFESVDHETAIFVTKEQFINAYKNYKQPITIKLNDKYNAIITKENITVGCQTFTHEKIAELYTESVKIRK